MAYWTPTCHSPGKNFFDARPARTHNRRARSYNAGRIDAEKFAVERRSANRAREHLMRKTKEIKRKRKLAAQEYKKGNRKEAYKMWSEAKKELTELRGRPQPAAAPAAS